MEKIELQNQIEDRLAEIPEDVRLAILSSNFESQIQEIGKGHALHVDQLEALGDETMLVMLGFSQREKFAENIQAHVRVSLDEAHKIASEISDKIFLPIRESMKKFAEAKAKESVVVGPETLPVAPSPKPPVISTPPAPPTQTQPKPVPPPPPVVPVAPIKPAPASQPPAPKPEVVSAADVALTQKTVTVQKPTPAPQPPGPVKPAPYKADPYREPPE
jgi:hypothetical protein